LGIPLLFTEEFEVVIRLLVYPGYAQPLGTYEESGRMLRAHEELLLNWFRARAEISSGTVEGLNNKIRVVTGRSYGFRTYEAMEIALVSRPRTTSRTRDHPQILPTDSADEAIFLCWQSQRWDNSCEQKTRPSEEHAMLMETETPEARADLQFQLIGEATMHFSVTKACVKCGLSDSAVKLRFSLTKLTVARCGITLAVLSTLLLIAFQKAHCQTEVVLYSFGNAPFDGLNPYVGLVFDKKENLYGTTVEGGAYHHGAVFMLAPSGPNRFSTASSSMERMGIIPTPARSWMRRGISTAQPPMAALTAALKMDAARYSS
jgi:hypothetical protein